MNPLLCRTLGEELWGGAIISMGADERINGQAIGEAWKGHCQQSTTVQFESVKLKPLKKIKT